MTENETGRTKDRLPVTNTEHLKPTASAEEFQNQYF